MSYDSKECKNLRADLRALEDLEDAAFSCKRALIEDGGIMGVDVADLQCKINAVKERLFQGWDTVKSGRLEVLVPVSLSVSSAQGQKVEGGEQ